ncbi:MAG TPA: 1,4-dihydroxy-2-naphthoate polyprenyltransferase [Candidatus Avamphibacillus intestinigallinarum]|nr:1,4-dihydroxy-2-naphthoate polyprenyltransferase [Candidatus Avamphibacillus intestinigallinarum]
MPKESNIKEALNEQDGLHIWWRMLRPHTLTASFVPVFVGTMLAWLDGHLHILLLAAMLLASILIQSATNMFNEYYDFVGGIDTEHSVGIGGTIVRDGISPKTVLNLALVFYGISILLGVYICIASSWWIAVIGLICMAFGYLYTGGPFPISRTPFGEVFAGFFMGTVIIGISYFIQSGTIHADVMYISIPVAIFIGCLNFANNIRDHDGDKQNGRKTLAILLGQKRAISLLTILFIVSYALTILFIFIGLLPMWSFITLLSAKKAAEVITKFKGKNNPIEMMPAMAATGKTNTIYGMLLGISLLISKLVELS